VANTFDRAMKLMRKHDAQLQEDGFWVLKPVAADHIDELIAAFEAEEDDHGLKCWLLELIGWARCDQALPVLVRELSSDDESIRGWAIRGLQLLSTKETRTTCGNRAQQRARRPSDYGTDPTSEQVSSTRTSRRGIVKRLGP